MTATPYFNCLFGPVSPDPADNELHRFYLALEQLRQTGLREFPLQLAVVLIYIASQDQEKGVLQEDLTEATVLTRSSVSRNVSWLGSKNTTTGKDGLHLVYRERDPYDQKRWRIFLTPKGKHFVAQLKRILFP
mgnify:FL=1